MVDLREGKISAYSYSAEACLLVVTVWCHMFGGRQGCMLHGNYNNSCPFFCCRDLPYQCERGISQAYCGFFVCTCYLIIYLLPTDPKREKEDRTKIIVLSLLPRNWQILCLLLEKVPGPLETEQLECCISDQRRVLHGIQESCCLKLNCRQVALIVVTVLLIPLQTSLGLSKAVVSHVVQMFLLNLVWL